MKTGVGKELQNCSRCGKGIVTDRWERNACYFNIDLGIDCCGTEALWGSNHGNRTHPSVVKPDEQRIKIASGKGLPYELCWHCHREFVKMLGGFLSGNEATTTFTEKDMRDCFNDAKIYDGSYKGFGERPDKYSNFEKYIKEKFPKKSAGQYGDLLKPSGLESVYPEPIKYNLPKDFIPDLAKKFSKFLMDELVWDASKGFGEKKAVPEYEILEFKVDGFIYHQIKSDSYPNGDAYTNDFTRMVLTLQQLLKTKAITIHSVRRNSDNTVWTVGDETACRGYTYKINLFQIEGDKSLWVKTRGTNSAEGWADLRIFQLVKPVERKPLFVTEDGKEIFDGDKYWRVYPDFRAHECETTPYEDAYKNNNIRFSTKDAAEEYVWKNKKQFSYEEIVLIFNRNGFNNLYAGLAEIQNLAKKRIKQ